MAYLKKIYSQTSPAFFLFIYLFFLLFSSCRRSTEPVQTKYTTRNFKWRADTLWTDNARWIELFDIWGSDENDVWAVGSSNDRSAAIWHWDGTKWQNIDPGFSGWVRAEYFDIFGIGKDDFWIVGDIDRAFYPHDTHGALLHYNGSWHLIMPDSLPPLMSVWGLNPGNIYLGTMWNGLILKYDGKKFIKITKESKKQIATIYGLNSSEIFSEVRDRDSTVYYFYKINPSGIEILDSYNYAKETFQKFGKSLWGTDIDHIYSATGQGITRYYNGQWKEEFYNNSSTTLYGSANNNIFSAGLRGALFHFNGDNWYRIHDYPNSGEQIWGIWCNDKSVFFIQDVDDKIQIVEGKRIK